MHPQAYRKIHYIYSIYLSMTILVASLCLMSACFIILQTGAPFSPQIVSEMFHKIDFSVYLCFASIIGSIVLQLLFPEPNHRANKKTQNHMLQKRNLRNCDIQHLDASSQQAIHRERRLRYFCLTLRTVLILIGSAIFLIYACNPSNYDSIDVNTSIIYVLIFALPSLGIPLAYGIYSESICGLSIQREFSVFTSAHSGTDTTPNAAQNLLPSRKAGITRSILLVLLFMISILGIFLGDAADVMTTAINICTECIGLG